MILNRIFGTGLGLLLVFYSASAFSAAGLTLQGRIVRDSKAITASSVTFLVQIRSPGSENCLLFQETHTVNMSASNGLFSLPIGSGTRALASVDGGYSLQRIFANRGSIDLSAVVVNASNTQPCASGTVYVPAGTDKRKIVYSFNDGHGSVALGPIDVSYNPMSMYALESESLGGFANGNLLRVENAGVPGSASALSSAQMTELMNIITGASVQYIRPGSAAFTAQPTFSGAPVNPSDLVNKAYVDAAASAGLPNTGTAGTYTKVTTDAQGRVVTGVATLVAADIPNLDAAKITTGTIGGAVAMNTSGNIVTSGTVTAGTVSGNALRAYNGAPNYIELSAPVATSGAVNFKLPAADGAAGQVLKTDGAGNWGWVSPSAGAVTAVTATAPVVSSGGTAPVISLNTGNGLTVTATNLVVDAGLGSNKIPQVGGSALGANGVVVANGTGTALASLNCTVGQVVKFDASGFAVCGADSTGGAGDIVNGGNTTAAAVTVGTNDAQALNFETNNATKMTITSAGDVGIGTTTPSSLLNVNGMLTLSGATGSLALPTTGATAGQITINGNRVFHTYGSGSVFAGEGAGNFTTTGSLNAGLGKNTFAANTSGTANVAVGALAFEANTTGNNSVAIGYMALNAQTTGSHNSGVGNAALAKITSGSMNTGLGSSSLYWNLTGNENTGVGYGALDFSIANYNTGVGSGALFYNTTGADNTAVGRYAGVTTTPGNQNATGNQNTYIGSDSGPGTTSQLSNTTAIGYGARVTASNQVVIGNGSVTSTILNGNVGIGTTTPGAPLDVKGAIRMSGATSGFTGFKPAAVAGSTVWELPSADGTNNQVLKTNGAGVLSWTTVSGTGLQPANNLSDVASAATSRSNLGLGTAAVLNVGMGNNDIVQLDGTAKLPALDGSALTGLTASQIPNLDAAKITTGTIAAARMPALTGDVTMAVGTTATSISGLARSKLASGTMNHVLINDGSGVMSSEANLAVTRGGTGAGSFGNNSVIISNGTGSALSSLNCTSGQVVKFDVSGFAVCGADSTGGTGDIINGGNTTGAAVTIGTNDAQSLNFETNNATNMTILSNGNVGVGTATPSTKLHVAGNLRVSNGGIEVPGTTPYALFSDNLADANSILSGGYPTTDRIVIGKYNTDGAFIGSYSGNSNSLRGIFTKKNVSDEEVFFGTSYDIDAYGTGNESGVSVEDNVVRVRFWGDEVLRIFDNGMMKIDYSNAADSNEFNFFKVRGTTSAPTAVQANDSLGKISFTGYTGTVYPESANIKSVVEGVSGANLGSRLAFSTSSTTSAIAEKMTIAGNGNVGIGTTSPTSPFDLLNTNTANTGIKNLSNNSLTVAPASASMAVNTAGKFSTTASPTTAINNGTLIGINSYAGLESNIVGASSPAVKGLVSTAYNFKGTATKLYGADIISQTDSTSTTTTQAGLNILVEQDGGSTVTNSYGIYLDQQPTSGAVNITNRYGLYLDGATMGTITNDYGIYQKLAGQKNYFAGNIGIGTTSPGAPLDVKGAIRMSGATSGYTGFKPAAAAGSTVWELPAADGTNNQVLKTDGAGVLSWTTVSGTGLQPANNLSDVASAATSRSNLGLGTAAVLNVGTGNNNIVQLDGTAKLPAVDGSALTNLSAANLTGTISAARMPALTGDVTMTAGTTATAISGLARSKLASGTNNHVLINDGSGEMSSEANLAVTRGGTGAGSFGNNSVIISNGTGSALTSLNCTIGQVIKFDASGFAVCGADSAGTGDIINGGNATAAAVTIGTNDAQSLNFETNNTARLTINSTGKVGIGTSPSSRQLEVSGYDTSAAQFGVDLGTDQNFGSIVANENYVDNWGVYSGNTITAMTGNRSSVYHGRSGALTTGTAVYGSYESVGSAGTTTTGLGGDFRVYSTAGTVTNAYGVRSQIPGNVGNVTNGYGVYTGNIRATNKWSFYASDATAPSYLAGNLGLGITVPTALVHMKAGTAAVGTAPLKFTSGTNLTTPENGAMEWDGTDLFITSGGTRRTIATSASGTLGQNVSTINNTGGSITLSPSATSSVIVNQTTASTSSTTGSLIVNGGAGIAGALNLGGNLVAGTHYGSTSASGNLTLESTSNASKGYLILTPGATGNVGIGTATPASKLEVNGNIRQTSGQITSAPYNNVAAVAFDFNNGNVQYTSANCQAMTLSNLLDGGTYTVVVKGTTSGTCSFTHAGLTFWYSPAQGATASGSMSTYTFVRVGNDVMVTWISLYQ